MCLMCEFYYDSCDNEECYERANRTYPDQAYCGRTGLKLFLWKGEGIPCEHILAAHGPECTVIKRQYDPVYGEYLYDECNCELVDGIRYKYH